LAGIQPRPEAKRCLREVSLEDWFENPYRRNQCDAISDRGYTSGRLPTFACWIITPFTA
jgi:hypothetical protein